MSPRRGPLLTVALATMASWLVLWSAGLGTATPTVPPPDLYRIKGHVRDPIDRGIGGAAVVANRLDCNSTTDPDQCLARQALTASDGYYEIPESTAGRFYLLVSKPGTEGASRELNVTVIIPDPVADFAMHYLISGTLDHAAISTANGQAQTTLTITSYAPLPGNPGQGGGASCVKVSDSRLPSDPPANAIYQAPAGANAYTWAHTLTAAQNSEEGTYTLSTWAEDCATATRLTTTDTAEYIIDNTTPFVLPQSVMPPDHGNTAFPSGQPLLARVNDGAGGSGVDSASITFVLRDETTGTTLSFPSTSWSSVSLWAKTAPLSLTQGHVYRIGVQVSDLAGNDGEFEQSTLEIGGGFLASRITSPPTLARIPTTSCTVSQEVFLDGTRNVACSNVPLQVDAATVHLEGTRRGRDRGYLDHSVPLSGAYFKTTVAGVELHAPAYAPGASSTIVMWFDVPAPTRDARDYPVPAASKMLGTVTGKVPAAWTSASIEMPSTATTAATEACADPSSSSYALFMPHCSPDPADSRYLGIMRTDVENPASAGSVAASTAGMAVLSNEGGRIEGFAGLAAARSLATDSSVAMVMPTGTGEAVGWWGEVTSQGCITRTLTHTTSRPNSPNYSRQTTLAFDRADGTCSILPRQIRSTPSCGGILRQFQCGGSHDQPCQPGTVTYTASHTIQDPPPYFIDVAWLRSLHQLHWDCTTAWWDQASGAMKIRSGSGPEWWSHFWPQSNTVHWDRHPAVLASYEGDFQSRDNYAPWILKQLGVNCNVNINMIVEGYNDGSMELTTTGTITPVQDRPHNGCALLHSAVDDDDSTANWAGESEDCIVFLHPSGDEQFPC